jgi:hypothetical protein
MFSFGARGDGGFYKAEHLSRKDHREVADAFHLYVAGAVKARACLG